MGVAGGSDLGLDPYHELLARRGAVSRDSLGSRLWILRARILAVGVATSGSVTVLRSAAKHSECAQLGERKA